ncbi:MAG: uroporphyrinogen decarboxylase family protein, partial [Candidatus Firestonebacteria bacterium]
MNPAKIQGKIIKRKTDFSKFLKVLRREGEQNYLPFYEHIASSGFISRRLGLDIDKVTDKKQYWELYADFWLSLGFDCIPLEIPLNYKKPSVKNATKDKESAESEAGACIFNMDDFEKMNWPEENKPLDLEPFEIVGRYMPEGVKIVGGVCEGPYEVATIELLGVMGLSYAMVDQPELVDAVFNKLKKLYASANKILASMDIVGACRQGDDLGFKTATFMSPEFLRKYVFPIYQEMVNAAHAGKKPFILHSCGQLEEVYEDLIKIGIDAKHSYEDQITPVGDFQE